MRPHSQCWMDEPCREGDVDQPCPAAQAAERRERAQDGSWSQLEMRGHGGGARHYLDGVPIHCGESLELQALEFRSDDYGEYSVVQQRGRRVRYELVGQRDPDETLNFRVRLHAALDGHEFLGRLEGWMRFRWPS